MIDHILKWIIYLGVALAVLFIAIVVRADEIPYWQVIMAEAVSEGYDGMYAVACVIRNRGGDLRGFAGAKRKELLAFCKRQGQQYISQAKAIERAVFEENSNDTTGNATHFENIEVFGMPYWAKNMQKTVKIGRHTFFR